MAATSLRLLCGCGVLAVLTATCSEKSPTAPSTTTPSNTTPLPASTGTVDITVTPNPVPFSGQPVTDAGGCTGVKNTWFYDQMLRESGGSQVTFRSRVDTFDGFVVNNLTGLNIVVEANSTLTLHARWCSGNPTDHVAQSSFTGTDTRGNQVTVTGPAVKLMKP